MSTLHVTLDELAASPHGGPARYAGELTRALLATAPEGTEVVGLVPASPEPDYTRITELLPGLARLDKSALGPRELAAAWRRGVARPRRTGMLHATSLLAPLGAHDRVNHPGHQVAVTIHDTIPWNEPELLPSRTVTWRRAMASRAERYADAIVVPSHTVAAELAERLDVGDRIRVIPGAPSSGLIPPHDVAERAAALELPERYLLSVASLDPAKNVPALLDALTLTRDTTPLVLVGADPDAVAALVAERSLDADRVHTLGSVSDAELGVAYVHAHAYLQPSAAAGFGLAVMEALGFGLPIVHTDVPALDELTAGAAISVPRDPDMLPEHLAEAIDALATDTALLERLGTAAGDRARAYSWRDSAARVWQLHADL
jgi:glycosyltransferase involved in cell wall biosynthesis